MSKKVCLDAGHYGKYNQSPVYPSYYESDMTWTLHNLLAEELKAWGIEVVKTRTVQATDLELTARGKKSAGCDLFLSIHSNAAANSSATYAIAICMSEKAGDTYDDKSREIGKILAAAVSKVMGCEGRVGGREATDWDRDGNGVYDDEWYGVLQGAKQVGTPGVIMEHGFHTNLAQARWLSSEANLKKLAVAEAEAIAKWLGIKKKPAEKTYYVQVGAFKRKANATAKAAEVVKAGFASLVKKGKDGYWHVQAGAYQSKKNAQTLVNQLQKAGFTALIKTSI